MVKAKQLDLELGGLLSQRMQTKEKFSGSAGQPLHLSVDPAYGMQDIVLLGVGKPEDITEKSARKLSGALKSAINSVGENDIAILADTVSNMPITGEIFRRTCWTGIWLPPMHLASIKQKQPLAAMPTITRASL